MEEVKKIALTKESNGTPVTTSLLVAEKFGKEHKNVLRNIQSLVAQNSAAKSLFVESEYENRGKMYPMYVMNRDGFSLLIMGFTGKKALKFKLEFIQAFNLMEETLKVIDETDDELLARAVVIANKHLASHDKIVKDGNLRIRGF